MYHILPTLSIALHVFIWVTILEVPKVDVVLEERKLLHTIVPLIHSALEFEIVCNPIVILYCFTWH